MCFGVNGAFAQSTCSFRSIPGVYEESRHFWYVVLVNSRPTNQVDHLPTKFLYTPDCYAIWPSQDLPVLSPTC